MTRHRPAALAPDPFGHTWTWDNTDVRYADRQGFRLQRHLWHYRQQQPHRPGSLEHDAGLGIPLCGVDVGNGLRPHPHHRRRLCGACGQRRRLRLYQQRALLGGDGLHHAEPRRAESFGHRSIWCTGLFGAAPYWRAAFEPHWGNNWLEIGTFGMYAPVRPWTMAGTPIHRPFRRPTIIPISALTPNISIRAAIFGSRCAVAIFTKTKPSMRASPTGLPEPEQYPQRGAGLCFACLRQRQPGRAHRPIFQQRGTADAVVSAAARTPTAGSPRSPISRLSAARAGMAVVQRPHWTAIHLVHRIQRNVGRRQRQQYAVPLFVVGDVAGLRQRRSFNERILLIGAALSLMTVSALAPISDRDAFKAPPAPPPFTWTGCYGGAQVGGGLGKPTFRLTRTGLLRPETRFTGQRD